MNERGMKRGMAIEYLKCRDFGVNSAIGTIVTKWNYILL